MTDSLDRRRFLERITHGMLGSAFAAGTLQPLHAVTTVAPSLQVHLDGDFLRISAPNLRFMSGKPLQRAKDGVAIAFIGQLTVTTEPNALVAEVRAVARFAVSYDIWEEKFAVTRFGENTSARRAASHLSDTGVERWCLDNLTIDRSALPAGRPFWVQLDLRAEDPHDQLGIVGDPGINITRLIEIFSRPIKGTQPRWLLNKGPFRLAELRKESHG